jgi:hypothetical protein
MIRTSHVRAPRQVFLTAVDRRRSPQRALAGDMGDEPGDDQEVRARVREPRERENRASTDGQCGTEPPVGLDGTLGDSSRGGTGQAGLTVYAYT